MASFDDLFELNYGKDNETIQHILKFWEPRVRQFAPCVYLDHYKKQQALCHQLKETRRRMRREFRGMTQQQKDDYIQYRNRFSQTMEDIKPFTN